MPWWDDARDGRPCRLKLGSSGSNPGKKDGYPKNLGRGDATASADGTIVVEIPARLKLLVAPIKSLLDAVGQRADQLARDGKAVDYASIERLYAELSAAIETAAHLCTLAAAAAIEPQRIEIGG